MQRQSPQRNTVPVQSCLCRHFDISTTGELTEVREGLGLALLEQMVTRDQLWITSTVSSQFTSLWRVNLHHLIAVLVSLQLSC